MRIERERDEAAAAARRDARVEELRREVGRLKSERGSDGEPGSAAPAAPAAGGMSAADVDRPAARVFHTPSGNVSCRVDSDGAQCAIASAGITFVVAGGAGRVDSGASLPRSAGESVGWGRSVTVGDVTCTIPQETDPRGVSCVDGSTGHGFEASRVAARQRAF